MSRSRSLAAGVAGMVVLAGCGDALPGFYSEDGERQALIDDCVDYIQVAAFSGDPAARDIWDGTGQDADALEDACTSLSDSDPDQLEEYQRALRAFERNVKETSNESGRPDLVTAVHGNRCNANYTGLCLPLEEDVDCLPGDGDGPWFVDQVVVVAGQDEFGLDDDGDGFGCEPEGYFGA